MINCEFDNEMRRQIHQAPDLLRELYQDLEPRTRSALSTPEIYEFKRILLTGCGDCHAAALSARQVFEQLIGNRAMEAVSALTLARYYPVWKAAGEGPGETLVIAMSHSGKTPRVLEAAGRLKRCGARIVALTGNAGSPLGMLADKTVPINLPKQTQAPGTTAYGAMLLACYLLAIRFGEVRMRYSMDEGNALREELLTLLDGMREALASWDDIALAFAKRCRSAEFGELIGSGCEAGTAYYGMAKLYEAAGLPGAQIDSEEWFHIHCFSKKGAQTLTMLFADKDNSAQSRMRELAERLVRMNRSFAVTGDGEGMKADYLFSMPEIPHSFFRPLVQWAPIALTAAYLAAIRKEPYHRGFEGIWREDAATPSSWNSKIETEEDGTC